MCDIMHKEYLYTVKMCIRDRDEAAKQSDSAMAAVLKLNHETVESLCGRFKQLYPVNYNCPGQLVVAGLRSEIEALKPMVKEAGGRMVPLAVSGGFHLSLIHISPCVFATLFSTWAEQAEQVIPETLNFCFMKRISPFPCDYQYYTPQGYSTIVLCL